MNKFGVIAVAILIAIAIVFVMWCVGTWDDNAGYEEFPAEAWEAPAVNAEGLKVQAVAEEVAEEVAEVKQEIVVTPTVFVQEAAVESTVSQVSYESIPLSADLQAVLFEACTENNVRPALALAVIETESQFDPYAVNRWSGCYGLCQLHPACFPSGLSPADNIRYGIAYLGRQIRVYGSEAAGLTAYTVGHDDGSRSYANVVLSRAPAWEAVIA